MNKLLIAAAGAGKTTYLIERALEQSKNVLITTFTIENTESIRQKIIKRKGYIPKHITIQTWFSFLIQQGAKPYQGSLHAELFEKNIKGLHFSTEQCGVKYRNSRYGAVLYNEQTEFMQHYFDKEMRIYSDKLSKFIIKTDKVTKGKVIERITEIYPNIYIDEVQDLSGHDLTLLNLLFKSSANILLVGDPRQTTYSTHWEKTNKKYRYGKIEEYIREKCRKRDKIEIDSTTLCNSHRNNLSICNFSHILYPDFYKATICSCPHCHPNLTHEGIFIIQEKDCLIYYEHYHPIILRYNNKKEVALKSTILTFGTSKGREFDNVLIFPTEKMEQWLISHDNSIFEPTTKAKLYVAITRAKFSVAFVVTQQTYNTIQNNEYFTKWIMSE